MLARRRLFQLSIFDLLLTTAAVVAMLVSYESRAPRALIYSFGFLGGLAGSAIAMNRAQPKVWQAIGLGGLVGIAAGWLAAFGIEALTLSLPRSSPWKWPYYNGRVPATEFATQLGATGGFVASALATAICVFKSWVVEERAHVETEYEVTTNAPNSHV
jgi:hypothetical protein